MHNPDRPQSLRPGAGRARPPGGVGAAAALADGPARDRLQALAAWMGEAVPHQPGRTPRPQGGPLAEIHDAAESPTEPALWRGNAAWLAGFMLYEAGFFWEAHEVWEPVWLGLTPNAPPRGLVRGLIQLANCGLKLGMGRPAAAARIAALAHSLLEEAARAGSRHDGETTMGLDIDTAVRDAATLAAALATTAGEGDAPALPQLRLAVTED